MIRKLTPFAFSALLLDSTMALAQSPEPANRSGAAVTHFITLGTMGGPIAHPERSQPANALVVGTDLYLIDTGDGAAQRLAQAGLALNRVKGIFISHLHFDHTGGLGAILGLRFQTNAPKDLIVYGPPGTKALVEGLVASMRPGAESGYGLPGAAPQDPAAGVKVVELVGKDNVDLRAMRVTVADNSHYSFAEGSREAERFRSLSFRFDLPNRSIVYTGDTGPSEGVEQLAQGADLLVSEMIDVPATLDNVRRNSPGMTSAAFEGVKRHLTTHHLIPEQVGELAGKAGVKRLVITHIVPGTITAERHAAYLAAIAKLYRGPVEIADDLDRF